MSWVDILKNQITQGKQGILTSDSPLPKKKKPDDNRCRNILRQWNANAFKIQSRIWGTIQNWYTANTKRGREAKEGNKYPEMYFAPKGINEELFKKIPEAVACKTVEEVNKFYDNPVGFKTVQIGWDNRTGIVYSGEIDRMFEVMLQYDINGKNRRSTVYRQHHKVSHLKVYLWEINKSQKTAIWKAEVLLVKQAYFLMEEFLFIENPFESFDIRELDWRKSQ